jgi:hypothetical protein
MAAPVPIVSAYQMVLPVQTYVVYAMAGAPLINVAPVMLMRPTTASGTVLASGVDLPLSMLVAYAVELARVVQAATA